MDHAQQREWEEREHHILRARSRQIAASRSHCLDCEVAIPQARRVAVPGVARCVTCQQLEELKSRHYRSV